MSSGTQLMTLDESGHLDLKTGNYKVNGTTVIDLQIKKFTKYRQLSVVAILQLELC